MRSFLSSVLLIASCVVRTTALAQCPAGELQVFIHVTTDDYGYETYWQLVPGTNACGMGTLFEGGNLTMDCGSGAGQTQEMSGYGNAQTIVEGPWCLTEGGTYTIHSIDDWGDTQASFEVFVGGSSVGVFQASGAANAFPFIVVPPVARDLAVTDLTTSLFAEEGESIPVRGTLTSYGAEPVTDLRLNYSVDNGPAVTQQITGLALVSGQKYVFEHATPWTPATGAHELRVWADAINGGADLAPENDARVSEHVVRARTLDRIADILASSEPVITLVANSDQDLLVPRDLAFHPDPARDELWVINKDTEASGSSTVIFAHPGAEGQTFLRQEDVNNWHFMSLATGIAFGDNGNFATSPGVYDANHVGGPAPFTGITLWSSDPSIYAQNLFGPLGSHLDMLHVTPNAQGIAHESWNVYWTVDGFNRDVVRHDFKADHGPGNDYHGNAVIRRYSGMEITRDANDHIVSHCVLDKARNWLYVVDHGGRRVLRLNTLSGTPGGAPAFGPFESYVEYTQMEGDAWEVVADEGLLEPAGIALVGDHLLVSDHSTGEIIVYAIATEGLPEIGRIATGNPGLMGIEVGPDGSIWGVNATYHQLLRIEPSATVGIAERPVDTFTVHPVPARDRLYLQGLSAAPSEHLAVLDATGRIVLRQDALSAVASGLDVSALANGHYLMRHSASPARGVRFTIAR